MLEHHTKRGLEMEVMGTSFRTGQVPSGQL